VEKSVLRPGSGIKQQPLHDGGGAGSGSGVMMMMMMMIQVMKVGLPY